MDNSPRTSRRLFALFIAVWCGTIFVGVSTFPHNEVPIYNDPLILYTADAAVLFWCLSSVLMLCLEPPAWFEAGQRRDFVRWIWGLGWLVFLTHVVAAFHLGHHWSHTHAYRRTEQIAGFGEGIFVNYLFGLIWTADAIWFGFWPEYYVRRSRWIGWTIHGFLAIIVLNASVIFGSWFIQVPAGGLFAILAVLTVRRVVLSFWTKRSSRPRA